MGHVDDVVELALDDDRLALCPPDRILELCVDSIAHGPQQLGLDTELAESRLDASDGIAACPHLFLVRIAPVREVRAHRVLHPAIGGGLDQRGAVAVSSAAYSCLGGDPHRHDVVAVHSRSGHSVRRGPLGDALDGSHLAPFSGQRDLVVLADEDDR